MRPLFTSLTQRLRRRHIKQAIFSTIATVIILLALLPTLLTLALTYQIPRLGLGQIELGNIDINPLRGKLLLEEVALYRSAARVFSAQRLELDLSMLSLLEHRIHIQSLQIDGMELTVKQDNGGAWHIAGLVLPTASSTSQENSTAEQSVKPWQFGIDEFAMDNSAINLIHPRFPESVRLERIAVGPLAMWRPDYPTAASLRLGLRDGEIRLKARTRPFSQSPRHQLELEIDKLPLTALEMLAQPMLTRLAGTVTSRMSLELQQEASKLALQQQGELSLHGLQLVGSGHSLSQKGISWKGEVSMADLGRPETLRVKGTADFNQLSLRAINAKKPYLSLGGLALKGLELKGTSHLSLREVNAQSMQAEVLRRKAGVSLRDMPTLPSPAQQQSGEGAAADKDGPTAKGTGPFLFSIDRLYLGGDNRIGFDDQTVKPEFRHALVINEVEVLQLDNGKPEQPSSLRLKAKDDFYTTISIEGKAKPFSRQLSLGLKAKIENYDMPPASPYLAQLFGYRITTGQLNSDVTFSIERDEMKGEIELTMNQLQLKAEDPARIEQTQAKLPMPLNTALSLLRDSDDNIKLKLPISGNLSDPQFALDDIIQTALGKALKAGSISYLKHLLQPYGTLITLIQLAGSATGNIQLDPVVFLPGASELTPDTAPYIEKLAKLLADKGGLNMRLCGFATPADLNTLSKGKEKEIPAAGDPALEALAKQRAETIKATLVNSHGVTAKQIFICHPELDRSEEGKGRVEVSL